MNQRENEPRVIQEASQVAQDAIIRLRALHILIHFTEIERRANLISYLKEKVGFYDTFPEDWGMQEVHEMRNFPYEEPPLFRRKNA